MLATITFRALGISARQILDAVLFVILAKVICLVLTPEVGH